MAKLRKLGRRRGWAFATCVAIVEPTLLALTKQHWIDGHKLPASGGCVVVSNHISHLDPFTFAHFVYDNGRIPRYLAKSEVFDIPVLGRIARNAGQIPVYRMTTDASHAFRAAVAAVEEGECVVVYPEGTITRDPELWPMTGKTGAARLALTTGRPLIPTAQWGANHVLGPYAKRPDILPRKTIYAKAGDPVDLDDLRGERLTPDVLRTATDRVMAAITALLEDIRGEQAPEVRFDPRTAGVRVIGNPHREKRKSRRRGKADRRR